MATAFTAVDLPSLPPPDVVETLSYEAILAAMVADLRARDPAFTALVESDPAYKVLEVAAYRELLIRQRVNDASRAVMLAFAAGADLDQIGANYNVARLLITAADPNAVPPVAAVYEDDATYRARIQLSTEAYTTAGPRGSYLFHTLSASGDVKDAAVTSLVPGTVNVAVLSRAGNGTASSGLLQIVSTALSADDVRPLCDTVAVTGATIITYTVTAALTLFTGYIAAEVQAAAQEAVQAYADGQHRLGADITRAGLIAALVVPGVQNATLAAPSADIVVDWDEAAYCTGITVTVAGYAQ